MRQKWLLMVVVVAALSGCTSEPKQETVSTQPTTTTEPAKPAKVVSFTVAPATIKKGESAVLSWKAQDAATVKVTDPTGTLVPGFDPASTTGEVEVSPTESSTYLLTAQSAGGNDYAIVQVRVTVDEKVTPPPPTVLTLLASPQQVKAGDSVNLLWISADPVSIKDEDGNEVETGGQTSGIVEVKPTKSTTWVIKSGTKTTSTSVKVTPAIRAFDLAQTGGPAGSKLNMTWNTRGATELTITEPNRGELFAANANQLDQGSFEDIVPALPNGMPLVYTLNVKNAEGKTTESRNFIITAAPVISKFSAPANVTKGSQSVHIEWTTAAGASMRILGGDTGKALTTVYQTKDLASIASGFVDLPAPVATSDYQMELTSANGAITTKLITVNVVDAPVILSFTTTAAVVANPGDKATLDFKATSAVSAVIQIVGGKQVIAINDPTQAGSGTFDVTPAQNTSYKLTVTNAAGATADKTISVAVTNPLTFTVSPNPAIAGETVTVSWDYTSLNATEVNIPGSVFAKKVTNQAAPDLSQSATKNTLTFSSNDTGTATLTFPTGFTFPFFGTTYNKVTVATDGFINFDGASSTLSNQILPSASTPNNLIALLWDDLNVIGGGAVYWELTGTAPDRTLVIQYNQVQRYTSASTGAGVFTGQIILHENGRIELHYLNVTDASGSATKFTASAGIEGPGGTVGYLVGGAELSGTTLPAAGDGYVFGAADAQGSFTTKLTKSTTYVMNVESPAGSFEVKGGVSVVGSGDLTLNEIMFDPATPVASDGQWIELYNKSPVDIDINGFVITVTPVQGTPTTHTIATSVIVPANGYVVIGGSADMSKNGGVKVDYEWTGLTFTKSDSVSLKLRSTTLDTFTYDGSKFPTTAGASVKRDTSAVTAGGAGVVCQSTSTFGFQKGTPGQVNTPCPGGYTVTTIPFSWEDVTLGGTGSSTTGLVDITFPTGWTLPLFGQTYSSAKYSLSYGYLAFVPGTSSVSTAAMPSTATPNATIAPFWGSFFYANSTNGSKVYYKFVDPDGDPKTLDGHLTVEWYKIDLLSSSSNYADYTYEAKIFQDGHIEFHYLKMFNGDGTPGYEKGASAIVGLENAAGDTAYIFGNKQPVLSENFAVSFTTIP